MAKVKFIADILFLSIFPPFFKNELVFYTHNVNYKYRLSQSYNNFIKKRLRFIQINNLNAIAKAIVKGIISSLD